MIHCNSVNKKNLGLGAVDLWKSTCLKIRKSKRYLDAFTVEKRFRSSFSIKNFVVNDISDVGTLNKMAYSACWVCLYKIQFYQSM